MCGNRNKFNQKTLKLNLIFKTLEEKKVLKIINQECNNNCYNINFIINYQKCNFTNYSKIGILKIGLKTYEILGYNNLLDILHSHNEKIDYYLLQKLKQKIKERI